MPERLWAPWRFTYLDSEEEPGCFFVELPKQNADRENKILFRGKTAFVILNAYPYTNGHVMVAPYRHTAQMHELSDEELLEINQLIARCLSWITQAYKPDGFNIGVNLGVAGGAGVPSHIHWHIVPRWSGDTNYMTTVGEVRVISQSLEDSYDRLYQAMTAEGAKPVESAKDGDG